MPVYAIGPRQAFEALPTAEYTLTLEKVGEYIEEKDSQYSKKGDQKVEWTFGVAVPGGEDTTRRVRTPAPTSWNEKSNFVHIVTALDPVGTAKAREEGWKGDPAALVGRKCLGTIVRKPKEGSNSGEITDSITVFAPLPQRPIFAGSESPVPLAPAPRANPLLARAKRMNMFAGKPDNLTPEMNSQVLATHLRSLGAEPMNDTAVRMLVDAQDFLQLAGGTVPEIDKSETIEQGLKALDILEKAMEALG